MADAVAEPTKRKPWHFTPETARIAAAKSLLPTSARFKARRNNAELSQTIAPANAEPVTDTYTQNRLHRVRLQLSLIDRRIEEQAEKAKPDGQTLNWLAAAQARLSEQERQLSNRSLPPTIRANGSQRRQRGSQDVGQGFRAPDDPPIQATISPATEPTDPPV